MNQSLRATLAFGAFFVALGLVGVLQSWQVALAILNLCLISAVMSLGVNIQWGYAGLFNVGIMAYAALGGVAVVLVSHAPVPEAWAAGGSGIVAGVSILAMAFGAIQIVRTALPKGWVRLVAILAVLAAAFWALGEFYYPGVAAIEAVNPARTGFLGGMGLPVLFSWAMGGLLAAGAAYLVGKLALGLRSDYLAIATLGISEIVVAVLKNEDWLARGVKNVTGLPRPVPYELELQSSPWFIDLVARLRAGALEAATSDAAREAMLRQFTVEGAGIAVKLAYAVLFALVLLIVLAACVRALNSPWGRMMRAIRDNEEAAAAMGKDITKRHLQVFVLGSAVVGIAGAMLTTLDGQFTPGTYNPLRFTFLIWVMVIVGGSGNNLGAVLGAFLVWFLWVEAEPAGQWIVGWVTQNMDPASPLTQHLVDIAAPLRLFVMGLMLLIVMRFSPRGLLPEVARRG
ncbi:MAG TPA: branched-chain amino acid ABC transporter permease [Rhizobiaceae bacterium]|nr:branched-chain amino acid ABC transporter permease [Rhizobiaceae bacterium]